MMRFVLILLAFLAPAPAHAFCKMALGLGLDISSSVNADEYRLQIEGLADALDSAEVIDAILRPEGAHIAAAAYEWSGYQQQDTIVSWSILDSPEAIHRFANRLRAHRRPYWDFATALGKAVEYGGKLLETAPACQRQVLDVSGDGVNNVGVDPEYFYRLGLFEGIVVNGLVIRGADPDPVLYYQTQVMYGPDAFVAIAQDFADYRTVMKSKLLREIDAELILGAK
ncbi:MAG: DUF1194 domain-containing protein [Pseudomonadota bacterium]